MNRISKDEILFSKRVKASSRYYVLFITKWMTDRCRSVDLFNKKVVESKKREGEIVDAEDFQATSGYFGISTIPALVLFEHGYPILDKAGSYDISIHLGRNVPKEES